MAKATARAKTKAAAASWVPQSREEVIRGIAQIGELQRQRSRIEAQMNDEMAAIKERHEAAAQPLGEEIARLMQGVQMWCEVNRDSLTRGGKVKSAELPSGQVSWRTSPPKVTITGVQQVLDAFRRLGLADPYIRVKEEINKEAILADPAKVAMIKGIKITQKEEFAVRPFETSLEEIAG